ncbi:MAG: aromatic ring-hydroxylating dioxygenase subunit alpha [Ignavibacteria bacterium]|nr:aromatic ring-hydroxylating dioxygenase subunit alpha [Ignavibacteria bacterium]
MSAERTTSPAASNLLRIAPGWYVLCRSSELTTSPRPSMLGGTPIVLFRTADGVPGVLLDRCPHRNVPLSAGTVAGEELECEYHGWRFRTDGRCTFAAGIAETAITTACHAGSFPVREEQGFVWVQIGDQAETEPYRFAVLDDRSWSSGFAVLEAHGSVQAVAENTLDVPHTAYLHGGLFRTPKSERQKRDVEIRRFADRAEAEYFGENAPSGMVGSILAPNGGQVYHIDRFLLPSITEVDYRLGERTAFHVAVALTPVSEDLTRLFAVVGLRLPFGQQIMKTLLRPLILRIFRQDAAVLQRQTENIRRFGGEQFVTTGADLLAPEISRLLKSAQSGDVKPHSGPPVIRQATILM